ncbi:carbon-nitrogen hydrolase family protein [Oryzibacter oryziterrae]|uniref:carbon-nitrogen hydrolase family protein n=1 Tax=Oryzibacter oryziterrae TaxID=2766474 RepID=UPI001F176831|nr:carbon-nitrogen hydrolase family protein [Oryzibacter oryziterrae]
MKIAALQMQPLSADIEGNFAKIEAAATAAVAMGADLLLTPELALTGYALADRFAAIAEPADGPMVERLRALARRLGLAIVAGFPERSGDVVYNSAVFAGADGSLQLYRKAHLYGPQEKAAFQPSSDPAQVFDYRGWRIGLLICFDVEFPETVRSLALAGAELVLVPTALPRAPISYSISGRMIGTRALENSLFVAYADLCGEEGACSYHGGSVIAGPDGNDLARAGPAEALLIADLDRAEISRARAESEYLTERRPDLYRL